MKELKDICIDLEYAKKLVNLGMGQKSIYHFIKKRRDNNKDYAIKYYMGTYLQSPNLIKVWGIYPASTAIELLELLPEYVENITKHLCNLNIHKYINGYLVRYGSNFLEVNDKKFPNALAKMRIYLIENKLMEVL